MFVENRARAPFAFSFACLLLIVAAAMRPAHAGEKNCASQIAERQQEEESRIDKQKALSLAKTAKDFESKTKGYKAEFSSIYFVHSFDPKSCDYQGLDSVNVVYALSDHDKHLKNVVAHLDAGLKGVKEFSEHAADRAFIIDHTSKGWSGYVGAALKNSGTAYETLSAVNVNWTVPKIDTPDTSDLFCVDTSCDVGIWAGLYGVYDETSGSSPLAQTGSTSSRKCSWEVSSSWNNLGDIDFKCSNKHHLWYVSGERTEHCGRKLNQRRKFH